MPGYVQGQKALATKILSLFQTNATSNLPTHSAIVVLLDPDTGFPLAVCRKHFKSIFTILFWTPYMCFFYLYQLTSYTKNNKVTSIEKSNKYSIYFDLL